MERIYSYIFGEELKLPEGKMYFFDIDWDAVLEYNDLESYQLKILLSYQDDIEGFVLAKDKPDAWGKIQSELTSWDGVPYDLEIDDPDINLIEIVSPENHMAYKAKYWKDEYIVGNVQMTCGEYFSTWKEIERRKKCMYDIDQKQLKFDFAEVRNVS